jgi:hypothetical protein
MLAFIICDLEWVFPGTAGAGRAKSTTTLRNRNMQAFNLDRVTSTESRQEITHEIYSHFDRNLAESL